MLVQVQEQKQKAKLSDILKNANEEKCFGNFMEISETAGVDKGSQTTSIIKSILKVCVNGLLMSKTRTGDALQYILFI
jgi:hypothetical protein